VAGNLLEQLRAAAQRCSGAKAAADALPAGFEQVDDVIVLLQPVRLAAEDESEALETTLRHLAEKNFLTGSQAIGEGGVWVALVSACVTTGHGFHAELSEGEGPNLIAALLNEHNGRALVCTRPKAHLPLANFVERGGRFTAEAIGRVTAGDISIKWMGETVLEAASLNLGESL
jgi:phosphoribosylformylglycinamidine (FGAM) synthase-like enzyme